MGLNGRNRPKRAESGRTLAYFYILFSEKALNYAGVFAASYERPYFAKVRGMEAILAIERRKMNNYSSSYYLGPFPLCFIGNICFFPVNIPGNKTVCFLLSSENVNTV